MWPQIKVVAVDEKAESQHLAAEVARLPESLPDWAKGFFVLGRAAILATGSKNVVCMGGGGITGWEAEVSMEQGNHQGIFWMVFAISRGKPEEFPSVVDWAINGIKKRGPFQGLETCDGKG